jgi:uncharacterized protein (DUF885 family)
MRDAACAHELITWPDSPIRYVPRPPWARAAAPLLYFLNYRSPAIFHAPPVHEYLVPPLPDEPGSAVEPVLRANNDSAITLNHVVHHGGLGHHIQNWHAGRAASRIGQIAAVDCASRIALFCGGTMAEGWACYATELMNEVGALSPLEQFAELHGQLRMCARAVVDVRLHQGRFTFDQALAYYVENAGMAYAAAHAEVVKNAMFPATALMYQVGRDAIRQLRRECSARAGAGFELRRFHDEFLSWGSIPVAWIAREMLAS